MDDLKQEVSDKTREASYYLWQSLITVNSLLATLLIAIAAFKSLSPTNNLLVFSGFIFSTVSCVLLLTNFMSIKTLYIKIFNQIHSGSILDEKTEKKQKTLALKQFKQNSNNEKVAILSSLLAWIIIVLVACDLFVIIR